MKRDNQIHFALSDLLTGDQLLDGVFMRIKISCTGADICQRGGFTNIDRLYGVAIP